MKRAIFFLLSLCWMVASTAGGSEIVTLQQYLRNVRFSGWTRPVTVVQVSAQISGKCRTVLVDVGARVPDFGNIAELDDTLVRLDLAKNRISQEQAQRQLAEEKKNLQRYTELINKKSTPQATYDQAALQADLYAYSLELLKVEERSLREMLARHTIDAPPGWIVTRRLIEPGEYVRQGEPVMEVGDFQALLVDVLLTAKELGSLKNMKRISLDFPEIGSTVAATIYRVSPLYDALSKKIGVELRVDANAQHRLRAGLQARLEIEGEAVAGQFVVPASALINRYEAHWLQKENGMRRKVILLGYADSDNAIISGEGLAAGQKYLGKPYMAGDR